ncbi:MAG TPA: class I SAM-dependent methyltransferase [Prosthecobacter sp.]|nr:class I SAM-dependent methyltransferase [Prosthecobacter sp.]HRK13908.1 class I SAM-dependent methyltransferase [Prosthecobacter sp.]
MSAPATTRSPQALRHHYEVEKELAARLRASTREERTALFGKLYGELFERVPDHPRHTRKGSDQARERGVRAQMRLVGQVLKPGDVLVEFAPGDGWLSNAAAATAAEVIGIDISDQRDLSKPLPPNVRHVVYDGYHVDLPDACADVVFSYQFLEHLHPDDVPAHFELARRLLKPGGCYVFDTPHRYSGPHDISRFFTDSLDCFHFQEWTHREMRRVLAAHGFSTTWVFRMGRVQKGIFNLLVDALELLLLPLPHKLRRALCGRIFPSVALVAVRDS